MRKHLFYPFVLSTTFQKILSVTTFVFVDDRFVFIILVKNIVLVWRSSALGDNFYRNFFMIFEKSLKIGFICTKFALLFNISIYLPYAECVNFDLSWIHGWLETMRTRMMVGLRQIWHFGLYLLFLIRYILHS